MTTCCSRISLVCAAVALFGCSDHGGLMHPFADGERRMAVQPSSATFGPTLLATVALSGYPVDVAVHRAAGVVYVVSQQPCVVHRIDAQTMSPIANFSLDNCYVARKIAVDEVRDRIYIAMRTLDLREQLLALNANGTVVGVLEVGGYATGGTIAGIDVDAASGRVFLSMCCFPVPPGPPSKLLEIDGPTMTVMTSVPLQFGNPGGVRHDPSVGWTYLAEHDGNLLVFRDLSRDPDLVPVGQGAGSIELDPQLRRVYVVNRNSRSVSVVTAGDANPPPAITGFQDPLQIALDPGRAQGFVTDAGSLTLLDLRASEIVSSVRFDFYAQTLAADDCAARLYVAGIFPATLAVLRIEGNPIRPHDCRTVRGRGSPGVP